MSADIYTEEVRYDDEDKPREYAIIGTIVITYEVETPEGERYVIEGTHQDDGAAQRFIDEHNAEFVRNQERETREREDAEDESEETDDDAA